ncbi:protein of unknown function [Aquiflexum balticum DSM 16537]|uniref:DUF4249 domain-containing protein n=1 Tax=Aquiflexum balticum DSM 16537 TaxID=758820 RepID=A0A1W2H3J1_9BACT|nr:DUF4249 domain-containing protein [Aquiflexum balticum]SMD43461.1 protein of unknown function [Aquiflexum balticum DSM 16537]
MRNSIKVMLGYCLPFLLLLNLVTSCIDRLDFLGETEEGQLVIYGLFTDLDEIHVVNVSRTESFGFQPRGVINAQVAILTEDGERHVYLNAGNGNYELQNIKAIENISYALEVLVDNKIYRSSFEKVPSVIAEDSLSFTFTYEPFKNEVSEQLFTLSTTSNLSSVEDPVFLRWMAEETHLWQRTIIPCAGWCPPPPPNCFIYDFMEPNNLKLFDGSQSSTRQAIQVMWRRSVDNSFFFPFFFSVRQLSINRKAYQYWEKIKIMINNQGSLFDIPPATIFGNISNVEAQDELVLGYFEVAKSKITRIYTTRADVPFNMAEPCLYNPQKPLDSYPRGCMNCAERAGNRKWNELNPEWWVFD